ncbi:maleate cis-trans isomerase family protein [Microbacterium saperdae]
MTRGSDWSDPSELGGLSDFVDPPEPPRIAVLVPSTDTGVELELPRRLGGAASLHVARMELEAVTPEGLTALEYSAVSQAAVLHDVSPELLVFACTSGTFLRGAAFETEFVNRIGAIVGAPVVTAARAMVAAIRRRGVSVRLVASYTQDIVDAEAAYLRAAGIAVTSATGLGIIEDELTAQVSTARLLAVASSDDDAEVVMLSCTNLRTLHAIDALERALGLPVVSSNLAVAEAIERHLAAH